MTWRSESRFSDLSDKIISIRRVAKSCQGGRVFSFSAIVVSGDKKGSIGYGKGRSKELSEAVRKASDRARSSLMRVPIKDGRTIYHDIQVKYVSAKILLKSARPGTGVIAGGAAKTVLELAGYSDIIAKSLNSSCKSNIVVATIKALSNQQAPYVVHARRGKKGSSFSKKE